MNSLRRFIGGAFMAAASSAALAQSAPHVHGVGELNIAIEGQSVIIELMAPGADIVGFEHEPGTDADRQAVYEAVKALGDGQRLFLFPKGADCRQANAEVETGLMEGDDPAKGRKSEDHAESHEGDEHAEFHAKYRFRCAAPEALTHVDIGYFSLFPRAEELEVQMITGHGQGAAELTPSASRLRF